MAPFSDDVAGHDLGQHQPILDGLVTMVVAPPAHPTGTHLVNFY
jgi:hypothetical protein